MDCCCECEAPPFCRRLVPAVVFALIAWLYSSFVFNAQSLVLESGASQAQVAVFHGGFCLLLWSLAQCLLDQQLFLDDTKAAADVTKDQDKNVVELKYDGRTRFCRKCKLTKPDRAHHCSSCGKCVLRMDHHCVFLNKCIGFSNYKFFLQFLAWAAFTCLWQSALLFRFGFNQVFEQAIILAIYGPLPLWRLLLLAPLQTVLVFFFTTCLGAALVCFFAFHLTFVFTNYTTLEYCEKRRHCDPADPYVNQFNIGLFGNFAQVFGTWKEFPFWFLPIASPSTRVSRGRIFPVAGTTAEGAVAITDALNGKPKQE